MFDNTNATLQISSGVDSKTVSSQLGHSNVSTTLNIYSYAIDAANAKASDALENILMKPTDKAL